LVAFLFLPEIVLTQIQERELTRSSIGCAFVVMQIENQQYDNQHEQGFDIQGIGLDTQKRHGEVAEARFLVEASGMGFGVSKPWGEERYDFILDSGHCFWRVQVKSTRGRSARGYTVTIAGSALAPYDDTQIDFLVAYLVPEDAWYVIPVKKLKGRTKLFFGPRASGKAMWEKYREGWCQMACPYDEYGPSKIVTPRCRDNGPVQMAICPLKVLR
jgi:hypothetical protein